ncbi:MAG: DUF1893 domain-containing protein [Prevotellaceae bacterium]|nr:DUF1893 domain-containing protein [Prevotellaceae bacterium]
MQALVDKLHEGGYSCVIANGGELRTYSQHGVADLMGLLRGPDAKFLRGASVADKVIGKAAAVLMLLGGVREVYGDVMSNTALEFLKGKPVKVSFGERVPHIHNASRTGWCPMDSLIRSESDADKMLEMLEEFLSY